MTRGSRILLGLPPQRRASNARNRVDPKTFQATAPFVVLSIVCLGIIAFACVVLLSNGGSSNMSLMKAHNKNHHDVTKSLITEGIVKKVAYYHCSAATVAAGKTNTEVVMLHGAKFTKEDWKTSGILEKLCLSRSVVALDFGVHMSGDDLGKVLSGLESKSILSGKPVALVSPSAGGKAVLDLAAHKSEAKKKYIHSWIPVAVGAVHSASTETLEVFKEIPVLAVYGSRDSGGKKTSMRLEEIANAEVVELEGGHPCYLDSPDAFVKTVNSFLGEETKEE